MRLSGANIDTLLSSVQRPQYDRATQAAGIIHFGIGAFHRAHQAIYTDAAMNVGCKDWGIIGVSLRSAAVAEQLNPQDGLYSAAIRSGGNVEMHVIGAVQKVLVAAQQPNDVIDAIASSSVRIVSFTITEKGYCRASDGSLDPALANESSVYRFLNEGLALRKELGLPGLTFLCCDNLAQNGIQLKRLLLAYLAMHDPALGHWVDQKCTFPSTMVDRIVPSTTDEDRAKASLLLGGVKDDAHVVTEPFSQWVIEDDFANGRPNWACMGAEFVANVAPYEIAKLRLLNGAHSALAYLGLEAGHEFVHQAVADPVLRDTIAQLMHDEAAPSVPKTAGQDLDIYASSLLTRFANPALNHRLIQIAMDGSQKIPQRWLETLAWHQARGAQCPAILKAAAAWLRHIRGDMRVVDDPMADQLARLWAEVGADRIASAIFGAGGPLASEWVPTSDEVEALRP